MTTRKAQLLSAMESVGDSPNNVEKIFYINNGGKEWYSFYDEPKPEVEEVIFDNLPEREFHEGYGGTNGEPCIAFTKDYVYICIQYDGSEWMEAIPRNPDSVGDSIPWPGGE